MDSTVKPLPTLPMLPARPVAAPQPSIFDTLRSHPNFANNQQMQGMFNAWQARAAPRPPQQPNQALITALRGQNGP